MIEDLKTSPFRLVEPDPAGHAAEPISGGLSTRRVRGVFGVSRDVPRNYVRRERVDGRLLQGLSRDKHVVLHGDSKQGKSSAWRVVLEGGDPLVVPSGRSVTREHINAAILRRAGASVTLSDRQAPSGARALIVEIGMESGPTGLPGQQPALPSSGGRTQLRHPIRVPSASPSRAKTARFEVDPLSPAEIAGVLDLLNGPGVRRFVVVEDFHRLSAEVQEGLASDLKVFHDFSSLLFVVVMIGPREDHGTPGERDALERNFELRDRSMRIDVNVWSERELVAVMARGERLLNVIFPDAVKAALLEHARGNVGRLQELCQAVCRRAGVEARQETLRKVGRPGDVHEILFQDFHLPTPRRALTGRRNHASGDQGGA